MLLPFVARVRVRGLHAHPMIVMLSVLDSQRVTVYNCMCAGTHHTAHLQLQDLQGQRQLSEASIAGCRQQEDHIASRLQHVQEQTQQHTGSLDGSLALQQVRDAVRSLHSEIRQMELQIALVQHQLTKYRVRHLQGDNLMRVDRT